MFRILFYITVLVIVFGILFSFVKFITDFSAELQYLNMEIKRTDGKERRYYIRQRRRLWLSLLPFVRY